MSSTLPLSINFTPIFLTIFQTIPVCNWECFIIYKIRILDLMAPTSNSNESPQIKCSIQQIQTSDKHWVRLTVGTLRTWTSSCTFHKNPEVKWKWVAQLCPTLCDPMDYTVLGGFSGQNTGVGSLPLPRGSSQPRDWAQVSHIAGGFYTSWATREAWKHPSTG